MKKIWVCMCLALMMAQGASAGDSGEQGVVAAVMDYVEGVYEMKPERIANSVHPDMRKHGFYRDKKGKYHEVPMTFEGLKKLAGEWNKDGRAGADAKKKITVFEVLDQTAVAKLEAHWGIDYFHLALYDGKWMITNVIWQSHPKQ